MTDKKAVTLTILQWQTVWNALVQRPYGEVSEIASSMRDQLSPPVEPPQDK